MLKTELTEQAERMNVKKQKKRGGGLHGFFRAESEQWDKKSSVELSKNRIEFNVLGLAIAFGYSHSLQQ